MNEGQRIRKIPQEAKAAFEAEEEKRAAWIAHLESIGESSTPGNAYKLALITLVGEAEETPTRKAARAYVDAIARRKEAFSKLSLT